MAPAAAMLAWMFVERLRDGSATSLGAAAGIVAGLVAVTPAAATVDTYGTLSIGMAAGGLCALAVSLKYRFGDDDSLDVVGVNLVGGLVGTIMIGFFANLGESTTSAPDGALSGLFYGGDATQLVTQIVAALFALLVSFTVTLIIGLLIKYAVGFRVSAAVERESIDLAEHGEAVHERSWTSCPQDLARRPSPEVSQLLA